MNIKRDAIWNTIGNFSYLGALWLMSVIIARYGGFEKAGYLSVALTTANIYISLASYTVRLYYAADIENNYSDKQYFIMRFLTTVSSMLLCLCGSMIIGYSIQQLIIIVLFYIYKSFEMMSDILFGALQRVGKLYLSGYSLCVKSLLSIIIFTVIVISSGNLVISLIAIDIIAVLMFFLVDVRMVLHENIELSKPIASDIRQAVSLLKICFPLFIVGLCYNLIPSIPRLFFERIFSPEEFGIYSSISTITVLISTTVNCVTIPLIPIMTKYYRSKQMNKLKKFIWVNVILTIFLGACALCFVHFFGESLLIFIFGDKMKGYTSVFEWIIIAVICTSIIICLNNFFTAIDRQKMLLYANIIAVMVCAALAFPLCKNYYMNGVAYDLIVAQVVELFILVMLIRKVMKEEIINE